MKIFLFFMIAFSLIGQYCEANDSVTIKYAKLGEINDHRHEYFIELLELALNKTETKSNNIRLKTTKNIMTQGRAIHQLAQRKNIDVVWAVTSKAREQLLLPIRIPLLKGLLGYRVLIIRIEDRGKFSAVNNIE